MLTCKDITLRDFKESDIETRIHWETIESRDLRNTAAMSACALCAGRFDELTFRLNKERFITFLNPNELHNTASADA